MPDVDYYVESFFKARTKGEKAVKMPGNKDIVTLVDKWAHEYCGRVYPYDKKGPELFETGLEGLYRNEYKMWNKDIEHIDFMLGILARAGLL